MIKLIANIEDFMKKIGKNYENKKINENKNKNKSKEALNYSEYDIEIQNYKNKMEKLSDSLDKQVFENNKNKVIINSQSRLIEKLQNNLILKEKPEYKSRLTKNINKKINIFISKNKGNSNLMNNNELVFKSQNFLKNNRGISAKIKKRRKDIELSTGKTTIYQHTNSISRYNSNNNTFFKDNIPIRISSEINI